MTKAILVLNAGSSSLKYSLYKACEDLELQVSGQISRIGQAPAHENSDGLYLGPLLSGDASHEEIIRWLLNFLKTFYNRYEIVVVGHRVVHGGVNFKEALLLGDEHIDELSSLCALAPNHQPHNLAGIQGVKAEWPEVAQVACFDTSFHRSQPQVAQLIPLTKELADEGVLRYGFHGLSYDYISCVLPDVIGEKALGRVLILHLGHGCSICALKEGASVATTMGYTAIGGLMMGRRPGDIDPGVLLYLMREKGMDLAQLEHFLNKECGLLGMSQLSDDMRDLLDSSEASAQDAVDLFVYRIVQSMGSLIATLGGLDALVFTAGIGENSPEVRARICEGFGWLGVEIDPEKNELNKDIISPADASLPVLALKTNEELIIARHSYEIGFNAAN